MFATRRHRVMPHHAATPCHTPLCPCPILQNSPFFSRGLEPYPTAWHIRSAFSGASGAPIARLAVKHGEDVTKHWTGAIVGRESVVSHWNFKPGERKRVYVYTNGDEAELFLN